MSNAPRYRLVGYDIGTAPDENGGWVHWTDHEAEIAKLTAERDAAILAVEMSEAAAFSAGYEAAADARQADLEKAWMMARDAAAEWHGEREQDELAIASKYRGGSNPWFSHCQSAKSHKDASDAIRALTPPADLAAKIGGEA